MRNCAASLEILVSMPVSRLRQTGMARYFAVQAPAEWRWEQIGELAVRLNYNGPGGVQKALDRAVRKLREHFGSGEWSRWQAAKRMIKLWQTKK